MKGNKVLEDLLGQTKIFEKITNSKAIPMSCFISAPSGQGKHYLMDKLADYYSYRQEICLLRLAANGSGVERTQDFAPFLSMLSEVESIVHTNISGYGKSFVALIPYIGKVISQLLTYKKIYPVAFSGTEVELLTRIERVAGAKIIIFLCEEINNWDQPSIRFVNKLLSYTIGTRKIVFICTGTPEAQTTLHLDSDRCFTLDLIQKQDIEKVLNTISPGHSLSRSTIEKIYTLSSGNIGIIVKLCDLIEENRTGLINESDTYRNITLQKLRSILNDIRYGQTVGLLDHASLIGEHAYKKLLQIYTKYGCVEFSDSLHISTENDILTDNVDTVFFNSREIWWAFHSANFGNKQFHLELAKCIQTLMPSNFSYIGDELCNAGQEQEAAVYYILALLHDYHTYRVQPAVSPAHMTLLTKYRLYASYQSLTELYTHYFAGNFDQIMQSDLRFRDRRLSFERDYICALANINGSIKQSAYAEALNLLESWTEDENFRSESPFQWMRAAQLVLSVQYELHDKSMSTLLKQIEKTKRCYAEIDKGIERLEYDFLAKCNYCYSIDTAYHYTKRAVQYFKERLEYFPSAYPYYIALINSAANSLVIGKYLESIDYSLEALRLIDNCYPSFGATDAAINNLLIAGLLNGEILEQEDINSAIVQLKQIVSGISEDIISEIILRNNIAVMMCYKGEFVLAAQEMKQLYSELRYVDDVDDYYLYIVGNNDCVLNYLIGGSNFDHQRFDEICQLQPLYHDRSYFAARNQYLLEQVESDRPFDLTKAGWNDFENQKVGPAWSFWGKWLLFSDMQIWSD